MPTWWVTGATGFLGRHVVSGLSALRREHQESDDDVSFRILALGNRRIHPAVSHDSVERFEVNLLDLEAIQRLVEDEPPDYVIHCAGRTPPATEQELRAGNLDVTRNLLTALQTLDHSVRLVAAGSAAELGPVERDSLPVGESYSCKPADLYGRVKLEASRLLLDAPPPVEPIVARIFNLIGPGLTSNQAFGRFAHELLQPGSEPLTLRVGNLDPLRDFIDVRDAAKAMIALAHCGEPGELYHVGTGRSRRIGDGLNELIRLSGRAVRIVLDPSLGRPGGPSDSRADIQRLREAIDGWEPNIPWVKSLSDLWQAAKTPAVEEIATRPTRLG